MAEEGYSIAKAMRAKVVLLHVIPYPVSFDSFGPLTVMGFGSYPKTKIVNRKLDSAAIFKVAAQQYLLAS